MHTEALDLLHHGTPRDIQKLFDTGLLSPYAPDEFGCTPLHRAMNFGNFEVARYLLINVGMNPLEHDNCGLYPAEYIRTTLFLERILSDKMLATKALMFSRLEYDDNDDETQLSHTECNCYLDVGDLGIFKALLPYQCSSHTNTSLRSRINAASVALSFENGCSLEAVKLILEPEWSTNPQALRLATPNALIRAVAFRISRTRLNRDAQNWFAFAVDVVKLTPDLHTTYPYYPYEHSPFIFSDPRGVRNTTLMSLANGIAFEFLSPDPDTRPCWYFPEKFAEVLMSWLEVLKWAGIDLNVFGRREHEVFASNDLHRFYLHELYGKWWPFFALYLMDFKFGPEPEDWEFYWAEPTDEFAGDFWDLIENPPLQVPGSWVD